MLCIACGVDVYSRAGGRVFALTNKSMFEHGDGAKESKRWVGAAVSCLDRINDKMYEGRCGFRRRARLTNGVFLK